MLIYIGRHSYKKRRISHKIEHDMPCDFPVERPDEGREEDECLDGKERCKVETAVADAVNQQMASRFA